LPRCELCGRELHEVGYRVMIDRAEMLVCGVCARGRRILSTMRFSASLAAGSQRRGINVKPRMKTASAEEYILVEGYGDVVRRARERMGFTREALAALVGEKESTIRRIEAEQLEPTLELARKLERVLKVKLLEQVSEWGVEAGSSGHVEDYGLTLGDVAEFRD